MLKFSKFRHLLVVILALYSMAISTAAAGEKGSSNETAAGEQKCEIDGFVNLADWFGDACTRDINNLSLDKKTRDQARFLRGQWHHLKGRYGKAGKDLTGVLRSDPKHVKATWRLAEVMFYGRGDFETAMALTLRAIKLDPTFTYAHSFLGDLMRHSRRFRKALDAYNEAIRLKPDNVAARFLRIETLGWLRDNTSALKDTTYVLTLPDALLKKWISFTFEREKRPVKQGFQILHGRLLYKLGRYAEAEKWFNKIVKQDRSALLLTARSKFFADMPVGGRLKSRNAESLRDAREAVKLDPDYDTGHETYARTLFYSGRLEEALTQLDMAIALRGLDDRMPGMLWWRALYLRKLGRTAVAVKVAKEALKLGQSVDMEFTVNRIRALAQLGYYLTPDSAAGQKQAISDAVEACMMDERCYF